MDYPSKFALRLGIIAPVALFSSLAVASDYAMLPFAQIKLMDALVFLAGYFYGFYPGMAVATITWLIYGTFNPLGVAGFPLIAILIVGEMFYAIAGGFLGRKTRNGIGSLKIQPSSRNLTLGVVGMSCALLYDLWTNAAEGLIIWGTLEGAALRILTGIPFAIVHEVADFIIFFALVPPLIVIIGKLNAVRRVEV